MKVSILLLAVLICCSARNATAQQTAQPTPSASPNANAGPQARAAQQPSGNCSAKTKLRPGFLIVGTVFNEHSLSFPGTTVRIRCAEEQKYRWEAVTNSRGEFAVRVPMGHSYEVMVRAKNYQEQSVEVRTDRSDIQQRLSIRLQPAKSQKEGPPQ
jgi:hypothetical protein